MALQKDIVVKGITLSYWKLFWEKTEKRVSHSNITIYNK